MTTITVLGLGTMGRRIAEAIAAAGHQVRGFDPSAAARDAAVADGIEVAPSAEDVVPGAELIVLSLPRPEHVLEAAAGPLSRADSGAVVADLSTIDPGSARRAAAILAEKKIGYVDAPVLGRPDKIGNWTLPVGGSDSDYQRVVAILQGTAAAKVIKVGDVGAGSVIKVLNNLMFGAINAITAEAMVACRLAGVDPETFAHTVSESGAATVSNLFKELTPKLVKDDYEPAFALALLTKDNRLALQLAQEVGAHVPMAEAIDKINSAAMELGYDDRDTGVIQELYRSRARTV